MRRREFITLLGGAAATWPLVAHTQQPPMPVIGFLNAASPGPWASFVAAFRNGLKESGYVEGQSVVIEYRWAEGKYDKLPELAADLVHRGVSVIAATGGSVSVLSAKAATTTIPIVFSTGIDPVRLGLVASFNRPGGNLTGVMLIVSELGGKLLGLLREMVPTATLIAVLLNPNSPTTEVELNYIQQAARDIKQEIHILHARDEREIDAAFATMIQLGARALLVGTDPFFNSRRDQLVALAARHRIPAIYEEREYAAAGGLMSYGTSFAEGYRQVGLYTGRILKGEKAADLPVVQAVKFEFVINLKTAKALGLDVPLQLQQRADEVIE
jgi:putative ABC transport system substrate-binding protein